MPEESKIVSKTQKSKKKSKPKNDDSESDEGEESESEHSEESTKLPFSYPDKLLSQFTNYTLTFKNAEDVPAE